MAVRCSDLTPLVPALNSSMQLEPMGPRDLQQVIATPARDAGVEIEPGLTDRLITDLGYNPSALPRLAHALRETWNHSEDGTLTLSAYLRAGGIAGAVARTGEHIYTRLDASGQQALRTILLRLVNVFEDGRAGLSPDEFAAVSAGHWVVVDQLIAARMVTVDATGARLAHESLLTAWPRLHAWIDEDRRFTTGAPVARRRTGWLRTLVTALLFAATGAAKLRQDTDTGFLYLGQIAVPLTPQGDGRIHVAANVRSAGWCPRSPPIWMFPSPEGFLCVLDLRTRRARWDCRGRSDRRNPRQRCTGSRRRRSAGSRCYRPRHR
jgi:hypothetical protein